MRKSLFFFLVMALISVVTYAQPQGFSYQTVVRDNSGNPITNQQVKFRFSIYQKETAMYVETDTITTNDFGLVNLVIGQGQVVSGDFTTIDWAKPCSLGIEIDLQDGGGYHDMGISPLMSVPYAQYAGAFDSEISGHAGDIQFNKNNAFGSNSLLQWNDTLGALGIGTHADTGRLVIQADTDAIDSLPLFQVKDKNGKTVFAVYNNSVHVFVDKEAKKRSYGAYKGGFVVSGKNSGAQKANDILVVNADSTRIFTQDEKAGFGVVGISAKRGTSSSYMHLNPNNYFIGENSGYSITTGLYNTTLGYESAKNLNTGSSNVLIGYKSGFGLTGAVNDVFIGYNAGTSCLNGNHNIAIGSYAASSLQSGDYNIFIGTGSGASYTSTSYATYIGINSGHYLTQGNGNAFYGTNSGLYLFKGAQNVFVGAEAGRGGSDVDSTDDANNNVCIGYAAGYSISKANKNVFIGKSAGSSCKEGEGNIFIGYEAGLSETGSNKLYISNTSTATPLIYGDFSTKKVTINEVLKLTPSSTPTSPTEGEIYVDSGDHHIYCYLNGTWKQLDN